MRIVVTGASRGIGLELTRQILARGDEVVAAVRDPSSASGLQALEPGAGGRLRILACDVADDASVAAFASALGGDPVDALINNAGILGGYGGLDALDTEVALRVFSVNALGPLRVARALLPNLRKGQGKRILNVSSGMGSIGDNRSGGAYAYRLSKAALNMASRNLAMDLARDGIRVAAINPGWVKTDMGGPGAPTSAADSAAGLLARLDALDASTSGEFLDFQKAGWPW